MKTQPESPAPQPRVPLWIRWLLSLVVVAHFLAIVTAALTPPLPGAMPSPIAFYAYTHISPYLQFLALTNAYRFYAPNPGPTSLLWFRLEFKDHSIRWVELPPTGERWLRMPYQRRLCIAMQVSQATVSEGEGENAAVRLMPQGREMVSSYVRYLARTLKTSEENPATDIQVFLVYHQMREPNMVEAGLRADDLRLYAPHYLGAHTAEGVPKAPTGGVLFAPKPTPYNRLTALLIEDIYPALEKAGGKNPWETLTPMHLPQPIARALHDFPELLDLKASRADLADRVFKVLNSRDKALIPQ